MSKIKTDAKPNSAIKFSKGHFIATAQSSYDDLADVVEELVINGYTPIHYDYMHLKVPMRVYIIAIKAPTQPKTGLTLL